MTARAQINPTPTTTEAAEAAVLRGWRMAFWRPSPPANPPSRSTGHPRAPAVAATGAWLRPARPSTTRTAPTTTPVGMPARRVPTRSPTPSRASVTATGRRAGWATAASATGSSLRATRAGTRPACQAGMTEARTAAPVPAARQTRASDQWIPSGPSGRAVPEARTRPRSATAVRKPRPRPTAEATTPTRAASPVTSRASWARLVPRQRSNASSRRRWATRSEKALTMMKMPTTRAMPIRTSRVVVNDSTWDELWATTRAVRWERVRTWSDSPSRDCTREVRASGVTPGVAATSTSLSLPWSPVSRWASVKSTPITVAPGDPGTDTPAWAPTMVKDSAGTLETTCTRCPRWKCWLSKMADCTTTCPWPVGMWPVTRWPT